jgi:hypothetical protein
MSADLNAAALAAIGPIDAGSEAGPLQPFARLVTFLREQAGSVSKETLIVVAETAWDFVAKFNFPQVPDAIEIPLKAWLRAQIRPLIESLYAS